MVRWSRQTVGLLIVALAVVAFQVSPSANHRWRRFHWARTANPFNVTLGDNLTSPWSTGGYLSTASTDWSTPTGGWPMVLSGLKTLLETGESLTTPGSLRYSEASEFTA